MSIVFATFSSCFKFSNSVFYNIRMGGRQEMTFILKSRLKRRWKLNLRRFRGVRRDCKCIKMYWESPRRARHFFFCQLGKISSRRHLKLLIAQLLAGFEVRGLLRAPPCKSITARNQAGIYPRSRSGRHGRKFRSKTDTRKQLCI